MNKTKNKTEKKSNILSLKGHKFVYSILSTKHFPTLQQDIDQLDKKGKLSKHEQFREYIDSMGFKIPDDFPSAKYVIVLARENKLALANFNYKGKKYEIMIPPGYYSSGLQNEDLIELIQSEIIKEEGYRVERATGLHLKLLAVRSNLAKYGRNNISYVNDFGSFLALNGYFTDFDFKTEEIYDKKMLQECEDCKICMKACPSKCISKDNFLINVDKCITLYSEVKGKFPEWAILKNHNALFGCMKCQMFCPANKQAMKNPLIFDDLTEEETKVLLAGENNKSLIESISNKINVPISSNVDYYLPVIKRNLAVILPH